MPRTLGWPFGCRLYEPLLEEVLDQQRDVVGALAQRRQVQAHDAEPVEQILAEPAGA